MITAFEMDTPYRTTPRTVWLTCDQAGSFLWAEKPTLDPHTGLFFNPDADTIAIPDAFTASWPMGTVRRMALQQLMTCD